MLALAAIFLAYGVTWYEGTMPPVPSLQSYWAKIHVPIVVSSYAAFLVAFVFSCIYLLSTMRATLRAMADAAVAHAASTYGATERERPRRALDRRLARAAEPARSST